MMSPLEMQGALQVNKVQQFVDLHQLDCPLEVPYGGLQGMQGTLSINVVRSIQQLRLAFTQDRQLTITNDDWAKQLLKRNAIDGH